jgi:Flp pilus assembly protein TadG
MMSPISILRMSATHFLSDRSGNFGMLTALLATPLILVSGLAIDYSTASVQQTHLQEISDGAALAGGKIFDGTNLTQAKAAAENFIKGYAAAVPGMTSSITADGRTLQVSLTGSVDTAFMKIANFNSVDVKASAAAVAPVKPQKVTFTPTKAQGYWFKIVSIIVVRPNSTKEVVLGTVTYQPTTQNDSGQGTMIANPEGVIDLGQYTKLVLQMDIKSDGCPLGAYASVSNDSKRTVTCTTIASKDKNKSQYKGYFSYSNTLRTDNPQTSDYLFVDGKQMPQGINFPLESYFGCSKPQSHAWEDGGGWDRQDIFYTVSSDCSGADGNFVRLTQ